MSGVRWVKNLSTGFVYDVPEGHWSLADAGYIILPDPKPEPAPEPKPPPKRPRK